MLKFLNLSKKYFFCPTRRMELSTFQKWVYAEKSQIVNVEFVNAFDDVESESKCPFVILDVREDEEIEIADLPDKNIKGVSIPKINIKLNSVLKDMDALYKIPKDKYIICMCHAGVRSSYAAFHLKNRGYKCLNLYGGIDGVSEIWNDIEKSGDQAYIPPELFEQIVRDRWVDCKIFHPGTSCEVEALKRWLKVARATYKYYIPIHLIPFLLFKLKQAKKAPLKTISRAFLHYVKSICFMASYIAILKYVLCASKNIRHKVDELNGTLGAFLAAWSVFFETESRRVEIALFIMTRFFETLWNFLKHRGYVKPIWSGENIVFGLAMGIIAYFYHCEETAIKHSYLSVFKKFWGKN